MPEISLARRRLLQLAAAASLAPLAAPARAAPARSLALEHTHTGEALALTYAEGGRYLPDALQAVNRFLRDHYTGEVVEMDPLLLDQLHQLQGLLGAGQPFQVISAYRCPATNAALRRRSNGVASGSLHTRGRAIDIRLPGVELAHLRNAALSLRAGGVGYYPGSNFVHVDTGRVRRW